jgi:SAM-dependent methyltransferase
LDDRFAAWIQTLEARHFADLRFSEVSRALRALSSTYVERRGGIARGDVLAGAGKRAAFAMFYAPLHFLLVREIIRGLPDAAASSTIVDLGCGTGAAGAAWQSAVGSRPSAVIGVDKHPWALSEAAQTYRQFGIAGRTRAANIETFMFPAGRLGIVAAFSINEISDRARDGLLPRLIERSLGGDRILVVEPLAGFVAPWWREWRAAFESQGGRSDEWRFRLELPDVVAKLDRAAGLNHRELTGRSLWLGLAHSPGPDELDELD